MLHIANADTMIPIGGIKHMRNALRTMSAGNRSSNSVSTRSTSTMDVIRVFTPIKQIAAIIKVAVIIIFLFNLPYNMKSNPGIQPFAKLSRNKENIIYKGIIDVKRRMLEGLYV